ncbi:MAG TPA: general stress protein [Candidatus Saccharimonadales bacterium]|nr:general stress protein [Candidatus Saccharimonadales bacterium]
MANNNDDDDTAGQRSGTSNRGFASMDPKKQREIASRGGSASGGNFKNDREKAARAGRLGGKASRRTR